MFSLNILEAVLGAVAAFLVGFVWYSPALFGKIWMREMGIKVGSKEEIRERQKESRGAYLGSFVSMIIVTVVLSYFSYVADARGFSGTAMVAFLIWLGFVATEQYQARMFKKESVTLYFINTFYQLVSLLAIAFVVSFF